MFWIFERPWFKWWVFKYIALVGIGKTKWMRCLTFSDLSPGNEFAGGWRGRDQQCVELSLQLFNCCRPGLSIGPFPLLIGQKWVRKEREVVGETSAERFSLLVKRCGLSLEPNYCFCSLLRRNRLGSHCWVKSFCHSLKWWSQTADSCPQAAHRRSDRCSLYRAVMTF